MYESIDNLNLYLLNIGFIDLDSNWNWEKVYSPFARIYYVTEGNAKTYINGKEYVLQPEYLYLIPPFTLHEDECNSLFSLYYIHFYEQAYNKGTIFDKFDFPIGIKAELLDSLLIKRLLYINPNRHLKYIDPKIYDNTTGFSQYAADNNKIPLHFVLESQSILCRLISLFLKDAKPKIRYKDMRINKCTDYIHKNMDRNISISQLANIACSTEDHLTRIFKKETDQTPIKYMNKKKIERAQLLLLTTNRSVSDIALKLSFNNISYFHRLFKEYVKTTPRKYRSMYIH